MLLGARQFWFRLKKTEAPPLQSGFRLTMCPLFTLYSFNSNLSTLLALMLAALVVATALRGGFMLAAFVLRCALLVHHHLEARAVTELTAKDSLLLIERQGLECSPFGIAFFLGHLALAFLTFVIAAFVLAFAFLTFVVAALMLAFAFLTFMIAALVFAFTFLTFVVAAIVLAFAFLTHLGFLRHALLDACLCRRHSCCLLSLIEVVPAFESVDDAFNLSSVFGCHLMALRAVMMVALFFLVLAVAFALCIFLVSLVTLTVAA